MSQWLALRVDCCICVFSWSLLAVSSVYVTYLFLFFFQAEDGIRDLVRSRGLGDVYKRQGLFDPHERGRRVGVGNQHPVADEIVKVVEAVSKVCLLYTSDAADERSSVDLGGRRIINKKKKE